MAVVTTSPHTPARCLKLRCSCRRNHSLGADVKFRFVPVGVLAFAAVVGLSGCAFTNSAGQKIVYNPKSAASVVCTTAGCTGPDGVHYITGDHVPVSCSPNYTPCVPVASDVDCAGGSGDGPIYIIGQVQVIGSDVYGLDADHNGIGCE